MKYKKVALGSHSLERWGGAEYHLKVLDQLFNDSTIHTAWCDKDFFNQYFPSSVVQTSFIQNLPNKNRFKEEITPLIPYGYKSMKVKKPYDLSLVLTDGFEKLIPAQEGIDKVAYILTPPRFLWLESRSSLLSKKFTYKMYSKYLEDSLHKKWRKWDYDAIQSYDFLISNSIEIQKRVAKIYDRDSTVIYPPVDVDNIKFNRNSNDREDWFLYFGRVETYKGVELAIRAAVEGGYKLKIAGKGADLDRMKALVDELGAKHLIGFLGFVSDQMKKELYYKCKALLYPVFDEDFGIVPVEANCSGAPVIAFRGGGVQETIKEGKTGVFFDEYKWESLLGKMKDFENMSFDPAVCRKQAMQFSRESFVNKVKTTLDGFSKR